MSSDFSIVECDIPDPHMTLAEYRRSLTPPQHRTLFDRLRAPPAPQLTVARSPYARPPPRSPRATCCSTRVKQNTRNDRTRIAASPLEARPGRRRVCGRHGGFREAAASRHPNRPRLGPTGSVGLPKPARPKQDTGRSWLTRRSASRKVLRGFEWPSPTSGAEKAAANRELQRERPLRDLRMLSSRPGGPDVLLTGEL